MARLARSTIIGFPHQVTQEGNYGQRVFEEAADYRRYLTWAQEYAEKYKIDIWAYCLMPNHVHFVCVPRLSGGLSKGFNTLHMRYAQYFHKKKGLTGHLWKGRFQSCLLDDPSCYEEIRFIETNPVRRGMVERPEEYPWSSAKEHVEPGAQSLLSQDCYIKDLITDWRGFLAQAGDPNLLDRVRSSLKTGRPAGNDAFVKNLEWMLGRRLQALPRGRPRGATVSNGL